MRAETKPDKAQECVIHSYFISRPSVWQNFGEGQEKFERKIGPKNQAKFSSENPKFQMNL